MRKDEVRLPEHALAYLTDCTLATVADMAMKKRRPAYEFKRQIQIAQSGVTWMRQMGVDCSRTRAKDITGTVAEWAQSFVERHSA